MKRKKQFNLGSLWQIDNLIVRTTTVYQHRYLQIKSKGINSANKLELKL